MLSKPDLRARGLVSGLFSILPAAVCPKMQADVGFAERILVSTKEFSCNAKLKNANERIDRANLKNNATI
jgi:hypothetical protein